MFKGKGEKKFGVGGIHWLSNLWIQWKETNADLRAMEFNAE